MTKSAFLFFYSMPLKAFDSPLREFSVVFVPGMATLSDQLLTSFYSQVPVSKCLAVPRGWLLCSVLAPLVRGTAGRPVPTPVCPSTSAAPFPAMTDIPFYNCYWLFPCIVFLNFFWKSLYWSECLCGRSKASFGRNFLSLLDAWIQSVWRAAWHIQAQLIGVVSAGMRRGNNGREFTLFPRSSSLL